ncbi:MAG: 2-dehydropantoate 2-reductase [Burkholderiales bacterium]|nr:2-dehydropantoate 2-reductase [Burkholderiales bacterium]
MKFCIVGAGAIGGLLGARLAMAGHDVSLVARGAHLAAIAAGGLAHRAPDGRETRLRLPASERPEDFGPQDAVIVALKAYSIAPMLGRLAGLLGPDTAVVTAINGLPWWYFHREGGRFDGSRVECLDPDGAMLRALDPDRIVGCVVHTAAEVVRPGAVHHTGGARLFVGELDGRVTPRLRALAAAIDASGLEAVVTERVRDDIWTKLIGNLSFNPVAALTGELMDEICDSPALAALIRRMMEEGIRVGEAYGARFAVDVDERLAMARRIGAARISMLQDLERGRPLELDAIVGAVVELARRVGLPTPTIDGVGALLRARAARARRA